MRHCADYCHRLFCSANAVSYDVNSAYLYCASILIRLDYRIPLDYFTQQSVAMFAAALAATPSADQELDILT